MREKHPRSHATASFYSRATKTHASRVMHIRAKRSLTRPRGTCRLSRVRSSERLSYSRHQAIPRPQKRVFGRVFGPRDGGVGDADSNSFGGLSHGWRTRCRRELKTLGSSSVVWLCVPGPGPHVDGTDLLDPIKVFCLRRGDESRDRRLLRRDFHVRSEDGYEAALRRTDGGCYCESSSRQ